jgi:hypothetical protein
MTREEKRKAFTDGQGNLKIKRLVPVAGGSMELAIVNEGANGRTVLVAKSDTDPTVGAEQGGAPNGGAGAAAPAPAPKPVQKTKGGTSTADSRVQETADNPIGAGLDLTIPAAKTMGADDGPELPGYVDESVEALQAMKGKTAWERMKSMFKALLTASDELEAEEAGTEAGATVAAKADGGVEADASSPDFKAVIAANEAFGIFKVAENALYDTMYNVAWSYSLTADEKKAKLTEAAQAFADYVVEKLKTETDGAPADFAPKFKAALKSAQAAAEPQIREALKAAFPEQTESTTEDDDMDEKQVQAIAAKAAKDAVDAAVAPLATGIAQITEALKAAGLPDGAFQAINAQMPGNGGGAAPDKVVQDAVAAGGQATPAAKADKQPTVADLMATVGALSAEVLKLRSTVLPGNGEGGPAPAPAAGEAGTLLDAFGDFDIASQHVSG